MRVFGRRFVRMLGRRSIPDRPRPSASRPVIPGPFTTATFIGYLLGGTNGAIVATIGIFIPSFIFVAAGRPLIPRIRRSMIAGAFLDGVNVGVLALMAPATLQLSRAALGDFTAPAVAAISALLLIYSRELRVADLSSRAGWLDP